MKIIRQRSLRRKLIINVLLIIAALIAAVEFIVCSAFYNYYYSDMTGIVSRYARSFDDLSRSQSDAFVSQAREMCGKFEFKNSVEIQIYDTAGNIICSSNGFLPESDRTPDLERVLEGSETGDAQYKNAAGEKVYAFSYALDQNGIVRCITSIERLELQIFAISMIVLAGGILLMVIASIACRYYANGIIKPIENISVATRKIAGGDFKTRLEVNELNEIGQLSDTINYMASELESTEKMKNEFISSISHELRTPLTAIKGWGETVRFAVGSDPEIVKKGVDIIINEAERLSGLVEDLLDFSRLQSGNMKFKSEKVDIIAEIDEAMLLCEKAAKAANVSVNFIEPVELPPIIGDSDRIEQVFINIIDNAVKYNKPGGFVNIETAVEDGCVRVSISDSGIGISAEDLGHIKEKFYKGNTTVHGSGIGLAVADEIVRHHNGLLLVDSTENVGTTITVVLPTEQTDNTEGN